MRLRVPLVLLLGLTLLGLTSVLAQSLRTFGTLEGTVSDSGEEAPIRDAFVLIHQHSGEDDRRAALDSSGRFKLRLPPGLYDVFVAADSFAPKCKKVRIVGGRITTFDLMLKPDSAHLESRMELLPSLP